MAATRMQSFLDDALVANEVFALRPDYRALLMIVEGIAPGPSDEISETLLQEAETIARPLLAQCPVTEMPHIAAWREAYKAFGAKPNKNRNSLEALARRVESGLPRVNRLTDIYNAISVKTHIPLGGEDIDKYSGSPRCIRATGKETFEAFANGKKVTEHPEVGEVVWCDDIGVTCRRWNWRQDPRTALTDGTKNALFIMDALQPISDDELLAAADELASTLQRVSPNVKVTRRLIGTTVSQ